MKSVNEAILKSAYRYSDDPEHYSLLWDNDKMNCVAEKLVKTVIGVNMSLVQ